MRNTYFQFKLFRVDQDLCALKVCTDACIQGAATGAWLRDHLKADRGASGLRVLDIGTGTGLLSLMIAQALPAAALDAVELDPHAAQQAGKNFSRSPWSGRLKLFEADIRNFAPERDYHAVICNPPFYENDLKSGDPGKDVAKHAVALNFTTLLEVFGHLVHREGYFSVMLPFARFQGWQVMARAAGFYPRYLLEVSQSPAHGSFRTIGIFQRGGEQSVDTERLCIVDAAGKYTPEARRLLGDYYLYFPGD